MSAGATIALAMDLNDSGIHDFGLKFGDSPDYLAVVQEIADRSTERGKDLALGAARLAVKYGAGDRAAHSKNLEMAAYDPRGSYGMGLAYATAERGACHLRAFPLFVDDPFKLKVLARTVIDQQNANAAKWSICFCDFWGSVNTTIMADLLTAGLGRQISAEDLNKAGERIWNLNRIFNLKAGFGVRDDTLSDKITKQALKNGPHNGRVLSQADLVAMRALYYHLRGWDEEGKPNPEKLRELGLQNL